MKGMKKLSARLPSAQLLLKTTIGSRLRAIATSQIVGPSSIGLSVPRAYSKLQKYYNNKRNKFSVIAAGAEAVPIASTIA